MSLPLTPLSPFPIEAYDMESLIKRNPHADFEKVEASRPNYDFSQSWTTSKTPKPDWQPGGGAVNLEWKKNSLIKIDPNDITRTRTQNYKLMISSTVPRPVALVSTITTDGTTNLAPFSYFNAVSTDPPIYSISFVGETENDSLSNILATGELCISIVSDWFLEAANFTSINIPRHVSEYALAGLHPAPSTFVRAPHVAESAFSIECKLHTTIPIYSKSAKSAERDTQPVRTATLVLVEAAMFHIREDVVDERKETVDIRVLRPVWRGGGITYGSLFRGWETPRPGPFRLVREWEGVKAIMKRMGMVI